MQFPQISPDRIAQSDKLTALQLPGAQHKTITEAGWYLDNRLLPMKSEQAAIIENPLSIRNINNDAIFGSNIYSPYVVADWESGLELPQSDNRKLVERSNDLAKILSFDGNEAAVLDVNAYVFSHHPEEFIIFMESIAKYTNFISALRSSQGFAYGIIGEIVQLWPPYKLQVLMRPNYLHISPALHADLTKKITNYSELLKKLRIVHKPTPHTSSFPEIYAQINSEHNVTNATEEKWLQKSKETMEQILHNHE